MVLSNKHARAGDSFFFLVSLRLAMSALHSTLVSLDLLLSAAPIESHVGAVVVRVRSPAWRTFMGQYVYFHDRTLPTPRHARITPGHFRARTSGSSLVIT